MTKREYIDIARFVIGIIGFIMIFLFVGGFIGLTAGIYGLAICIGALYIEYDGTDETKYGLKWVIVDEEKN